MMKRIYCTFLITFLLSYLSLNGQHTLYLPSGTSAIEAGGMYAARGSAMAGIWGAYNGAVRVQVHVDKFTRSFGDATIFGARINVPVLKQSNSLPFNLLGEGMVRHNTFSGFSSTDFAGAAIISRQIKNNWTIISPYISAGYYKFDGGGDVKWTAGADASFNQFLVGIEYENIGGSGQIYFRAGYRFGSKKRSDNGLTANESLPVTEAIRPLSEEEAEDTRRPKEEVAEDDNSNQSDQDLPSNEEPKHAESVIPGSVESVDTPPTDQSSLESADSMDEQSMAEEEAAKLEKEKAARIQKQQDELERLRQEQEDLLKRLNKDSRSATSPPVPETAQQEEATETEAIETEATETESTETSPSPPAEPVRATSPASVERYSVQFFASSSPDKTFPDLTMLPSILIEKVEGQEVYRYKTGYFGDRNLAEDIAKQL